MAIANIAVFLLCKADRAITIYGKLLAFSVLLPSQENFILGQGVSF